MPNTKRIFISLLIAILFIATAFAQETTAGLQGTVKDPTGAVVPKAVVEVSGTALIGVKRAETDNGGYYRFSNLPPGEYTLTASAPNFSTVQLSNIRLEVGKLPSVDIKLEVGKLEQTVEVSGTATIVDVTQSKVAVNIPNEVINGIPKGRSFQSIINFAPGARYEPLQSGMGTAGRESQGYQIDGASNGENSYLIEGQETSDVYSGQTKTNAPFEFVQEVQIKTSGFEAEHGGALGGVVNVIQKRGGNAFHGSAVTYYSGDLFNAAPISLLQHDPTTGDPVYYQRKKDHQRTVEPGFELGGYLKKDRLWFFTSAVPRFDRRTRTVMFAAPYNDTPRNFYQNTDTYYTLSRLDAMLTNKIRVYGSWQYAYERGTGATVAASNLPQADSAWGQENQDASTNPANFRPDYGYVQPNVIYNVGSDITITPSLIATSRFGFFHADAQDRGMPAGIRYRYRDTNNGSGYDTSIAPAPDTFTALDGTVIPSTFVHGTGWSNIGANFAQLYDKFDRLSYSQDLAWFKRGFGTHNIKGGYAFNRLSNDTWQGYNTGNVYVGYGRQYTPMVANRPVCAAISAYNLTNYGNAGGDATACQGLWGTVNVREFGTVGKVSSFNHALYIQDAWTVGHGLTLNVGVRFDKETLPSYTSGFEGINFGFGDKFAPRLGGSWDVLGSGKLKVYGSFGYFYDIMKFSLPRGSFGGDYWHDCVYALDNPDWSLIVPQTIDAHFCPRTGGANGEMPARMIENQDYRQPSNDPNNYLVDRHLKPMKQHEYVVGTDWAINPKLGLEVRYSRKRLDRTIEDSGLFTPSGEQFYIVNPGEGINAGTLPATECIGCPNIIKPVRNYDGVEFRLTKKASAKWFGSLSYTYSRLWGNYSGLTSTEVNDGGGGRSEPNISKAFDEPYMQYDSHGKVTNGFLGTDRPHTLKAFGWYRMKWFGGETLSGLSQSWYSGTPLSSYVNVNGAPVFMEGRGSFIDLKQDPETLMWSLGGIRKNARTPAFSQTDLNFVHEFKISKTNENLKVGFEANINNLFNQRAVLGADQNLLLFGSIAPNNPANIPAGSQSSLDYKSLMTGWNYLAVLNEVDPSTGYPSAIRNDFYGMADNFQVGRNMRFKFKFTF